MFTKSIRWRLQLWLAFLLVCIVSGFGITAYQFHRENRLSQIDEELVRRVAALSRDTRALPGFPPERGLFRPDELGEPDKDNLGPGRKGPGPGPRAGNATNWESFGPGGFDEPGDEPWGPGRKGPRGWPNTTNRGGFGPRGFGPRENGMFGAERRGPGAASRDGSATNYSDLGPPPRGPEFEREFGFFPDAMPMDEFGPRSMPPPWLRGPAFENRTIQLSVSTLGLFDDADPKGFYYAIARGGRELKHSSNSPSAIPFPNPSRTDTRIRTRTRAGFREAYQSTELGECVLAGRSVVADYAAIQRFGWLLVLAGGSVLVLGLGGTWLLAGRAIRPIAEISATASHISAGNLAERINVAETDSELGHLAGVLNSAFANLEAAFAQQRQFTADAAHELRTPLAVLVSETQTTLRRARSEAEYREALETCLDTAQQMRRLTQSLLELARLDSNREELTCEDLDLATLAGDCADFIRSLGEDRKIRITCDLAPAPVFGNADRLSQVLTNLLNNAIQYGKDGGEVRVSTRAENGSVHLSVADNGPGISADDLPHIFKRFYRADKARARASGHAGLGLAICRAIVEAHGGTIAATSTLNAGTTVTVCLPSTAASQKNTPPSPTFGGPPIAEVD